MGAAIATAFSEFTSGVAYIVLMLRRKLVRVSLLFRPPSIESLIPLVLGGVSLLGRQMALNLGFLLATRRAQSLDPITGIAAAAYGIVMQISSVTGVMHIAMQCTAAALVPSTLAKSGPNDARRMADRIFFWGTILGLLLGSIQYLSIPYLVPLFTPIPEVQEAIRIPAAIASLLHVANGPVFVGEGVMLGLRCYRDLLLITAIGISTMVAGLASPIGQKLNGILVSFLAFCIVQAIAVVIHYLKFGPLASQKDRPV
jgi:Na+-driven multidrug efflux pump